MTASFAEKGGQIPDDITTITSYRPPSRESEGAETFATPTETASIVPVETGQPLRLNVRIPYPKILPEPIAHVLAGCPILWRIVDLARQGKRLAPEFRHVLIYVLTMLGDEGRVFLHQLLNQGPEYDPNELNRAIHAVPPNAMSCSRIRKTLSELVEELPCNCQFRLPQGCYASPIVHAGIIPSSSGKIQRGREGAAPSNLSGREHLAGLSGGIDQLMQEYQRLQEQMASLARREALLREHINRIFQREGKSRIETKLGVYTTLPSPEHVSKVG